MAKEGAPPPRLLIVSDLDYTMVDHNDTENTALLRFGALWEAGYRHDSMLVFSTGRSQYMYQKLRAEVPLLTPDIAITSVGTEIVYGDSLESDAGWEEELNVGWDRNAVVEETTKLGLRRQPESEQRPHKLSFFIDGSKYEEIVGKLSTQFKARGLDIKFIFSGGRDLDILSRKAGKGQALAYLLKKFEADEKSPGATLVCGDSGNDAELFAVPDVHGVLVGNAMDELVRWYLDNAKDNPRIIRATERGAGGILQAMQHFNFIPYVSPRDLSWKDLVKKGQVTEDETSRVAFEVVEYELYFERWFRGEVENSDEGFDRLKYTLDENASLILPQGKEINPHLAIDKARSQHGAFPHLRIWVDRLNVKRAGDKAWTIRYDKWQKISPAEELCCRVTSAVIGPQEGTPNGLKWVQVHDSWLEGHEPKPLG